MPQEPSRDSWVERYENDVYKRFSETAKLGACRPPSLSGIIQCDRPIERGGRCVLHTPKLTEAERRLLEPFDLTMEQSLEHRFLEALRSERGIADFSSIHFPALQWNQSPLRELLTRQGSVNFNMAVFHQKADFSGIHFSSRPSFMRTVFRDAVTFTSASFASGRALAAARARLLDYAPPRCRAARRSPWRAPWRRPPAPASGWFLSTGPGS